MSGDFVEDEVLPVEGEEPVEYLRTFEIGLFKLDTGAVVSHQVPTNADLYQIVIVDNDPYAVFVVRSLTEDELEKQEVQDKFFSKLGKQLG